MTEERTSVRCSRDAGNAGTPACIRPGLRGKKRPGSRRTPAPNRVWVSASLRIFLGMLLLACVALPASPARGQPDPVTATGSSGVENSGDPNTVPPPQEMHERFVLANEDYLEGRYEEAAGGYEAILAGERGNGHVFYNLGNCCIRLGQVGKAVLNYRKALLLLPRDGDLKANLQYARSLCQDRIEERPSSIGHTLAFWYHAMNLRGLFLAFCALNLLLWASLFVRLFRDSEWIRWTIALSLILTVLMGVSAFMKYRETFRNRDGVVIEKETPVRAGFSHKDTVLFVLHEGTEFRILDREKGWWKIDLPDGKKGWMPSAAGGSVSLGRPEEPSPR
jgi:hypothetical protein